MDAVNKLIESIEPALTKLSETFCVSVDTIRENGMQYVMMYGRYSYINDTVFTMAATLVVYLILCFLVWGFLVSEAERKERKMYVSYEEGTESIESAEIDLCDKKETNKALAVIVFALLLVEIIVFCICSIPYWACPEMYSVNAVMDLIR